MLHHKYFRYASLLLGLTSFNPAFGQGQNPGNRTSDAPQSTAQDDRYLIEFRSWGAHAPAAVRAAGGQVLMEFPQLRGIAARLPPQAARALQNNPVVSFVEVDPRRYPMSTAPTAVDTVQPNQQTSPYGISMIQADQITGANPSNRKVCIIDSGYYQSHEDLQKAYVTASPDSGTGDPFNDLNGHGTHVAGTIAALANTTGVVGVHGAGLLNLHIVKVFGDNGSWTYSSNLITALDKCRQAGSHVVSMSLGGDFSSRMENNAFANAYSAGVLSVAAAGNGGNTKQSYPASYDSVISVAAIDSNRVVADFSQKNGPVELAAPGVAVLSTVPFNETNTITVNGVTRRGTWIEYAARSEGTTGNLVDGGLCDATGAWTGRVVLCERGVISFYDKVRTVQNSGAVAAVIYNNVDGAFSGTLGDGYSSTIPVIGISRADGTELKATALGLSSTVVSKIVKPASGYEAWDGTSMATPHVSGVAAVIWSFHPGKANADIRKVLQDTATDLGAAGRDTSYGFGLIQAKAALDALGGGSTGTGDTTPPVITNVSSQQVSRNGTFRITWSTNEPASSKVTFTSGTTGTYTDSTLVTNHSIQLKGSRGVLYVYSVSSTDAAGNANTAGPFEHQN